MKRRITDLFKSMLSKTKKLSSRHIIAHNQKQAQHSKKVQKRRKANKAARAQRKVNRKAA